MIKKHLKENEFIEMEIHHSKKLPFRLADWLRSFIFICIIFAGIVSIRSDGFFSIGTVFLLAVFFVGILPLFFRWKKFQPLKYFITNKRLLIFNQSKNILVHSFEFNQFPEFNLYDKANNSGYITIGEEQKILSRHGLFNLNVGINLADHEIVLENIPNVREIYNKLKVKIKEVCQQPQNTTKK